MAHNPDHTPRDLKPYVRVGDRVRVLRAAAIVPGAVASGALATVVQVDAQPGRPRVLFGDVGADHWNSSTVYADSWTLVVGEQPQEALTDSLSAWERELLFGPEDEDVEHPVVDIPVGTRVLIGGGSVYAGRYGTVVGFDGVDYEDEDEPREQRREYWKVVTDGEDKVLRWPADWLSTVTTPELELKADDVTVATVRVDVRLFLGDVDITDYFDWKA